MTPTPLEKANALFNELADVAFENVAHSKAIADQLFHLCKLTGGDFTARVAYAQALLQSGHRGSAIEQVDTAFSLRNKFHGPAMDRLAMLLMFTADLRAVQVAKEIAFLPAVKSSVFAFNQSQIAAWAMDVPFLTALNDHHLNLEVATTAGAFLRTIEAASDIGNLILHQTIVREQMRDSQVAVCFSLVQDDGDWYLTNNIFFDRTKAKRREIEKAVDAALGASLSTDLSGVIFNNFTAAPTLNLEKVVSFRPPIHPVA